MVKKYGIHLKKIKYKCKEKPHTFGAGFFNYQKRWKAENESSGIYFVKMNTNNFTQTQKIILSK